MGFYYYLDGANTMINGFIKHLVSFFQDYGFVGMLLILISTKRSKELLDILWEIKAADKKIAMFEAEESDSQITQAAIKAKVAKAGIYTELYNQKKFWWLPAR